MIRKFIQASLDVSFHFCSIISQIFTLHNFYIFQTDSCCNRMSAVCVNMPEMLELVCFSVKGFKDLFLDDSRSHRHITTGHTFSKGKNVGLDSPVFVSKHFSGSAESGNNFVHNQQNIVLITDLPDFSQIIIRRYKYSSSGNHRFHDESRHCFFTFVNNGIFQKFSTFQSMFFNSQFLMTSVWIRWRNVQESWSQRFIADLTLSLTGSSHCGQSVAVISTMT